MITTYDIDSFYRQYLHNMDVESGLLDEMLKPHSESGWLEYLSKRSSVMHALYSSNEELLNKYLRPLLNGKEELTDEIAQALLKHVYGMYERQLEYLLVGQVTQMLEAYFEEKGYINEHVKCLIILGELYLQIAGESGLAIARRYYDKLAAYRNRLDELNDDIIAKYLILSSLRGLPVSNSRFSTIEDCMKIYDQDLLYLHTDKVKNSLSRIGINDPVMVTNFSRFIFVPKILDIYEVRPDDVNYRKLFELFEETYYACLNNVENEFELNPNITLCYYKTAWLTGRITVSEVIRKYLDYYEYMQTPEHRDKDVYEPLIARDIFSLITMYLPDAFIMLNYLEDEEKPAFETTSNDILRAITDFFESVSYGKYDIYLSQQAYEIFEKILPCINEEGNIFDLLFNIVIKRDPDVTVHSYMVGELSKLIFDEVFEKRPELLIGCFNTNSVRDVRRYRELMRDFLEQGCQLHDLGKIGIGYITRKQTRALCPGEFEFIQSHPEMGADLASANRQISRYSPIIIGHHKSYDDKGGYPKSYSCADKSEAILVNIVKLSDSLEAATDSIGRIYAPVKDSDTVINEFIQGRGSQYNPDLVDLIASSDELRKKLSILTTTGRAGIVSRVYKTAEKTDRRFTGSFKN